MNRSWKQSCGALRLARSDGAYPAILLARLRGKAPEILTAIGPVEYLVNRKTALFCSVRTPGEAILRAHDMAGACVMRGQRSSADFNRPSKKNA